MINLEHNEFVRMTGSGSAIIAYFKTKNASLNAAKVIKKIQKLLVYYLKLYKVSFVL